MIDIHVLALGSVALPEWHPRAPEGRAVIQGCAVVHPDGVVLFDTGVGVGNDIIDELYSPKVVSVVDELHRVGIDERDVVGIVNSHLHFDHCGQNHSFDVPIFARADEIEAAAAEFYTVPEWAAIPPERLRLLTGDEEIAPGITVVETPGHTPGHQSIVINSSDGPIVLAGQCCYRGDEWERGEVASDNLFDEASAQVANDSLRRLRSLDPAVVHFSHDTQTVRRA